jgi:hypothetical protein
MNPRSVYTASKTLSNIQTKQTMMDQILKENSDKAILHEKSIDEVSNKIEKLEYLTENEFEKLKSDVHNVQTDALSLETYQIHPLNEVSLNFFCRLSV